MRCRPCRYKVVKFLPNPHNRLHSLHVKARYWVSFVSTNPDLYFASINLFMFTISYYIGPHYNDTWLYLSILIEDSWSVQLSLGGNFFTAIYCIKYICSMTSWHGNAFHITGLLWGESTSHWWFHSQRPIMHTFVLWLNKLLKNSRNTSDLRGHDAHVMLV